MLKRKIVKSMEAWKKNKTRQALLVTGARQIGKTYIIREFAKNNYAHFVEINLVENDQALAAFNQVQTSEDYLVAISLFAGDELVENETLIFIDEVQESKEIVTAIKFLVDRGGYDYVLSGSLLGVELNNIKSFPVGYLHTIDMFPLDFEEYCWARGVGSPVFEELRIHFLDRTIVPDYLHKRLLKLFHEYLIIGGLPDPIQVFARDLDVQKVRAVQDDIVALYKKDISKYKENRAREIKRIFDLIPAELNHKNKKFTIKSIDGVPRFDRYEDDFLWLVDANVAIAVYNVGEPRHPLLLSADERQFKLFLSDVGLMASMCGLDVTRDAMTGNTSVNYGSFYENVAAQELKAHGYTPYFYKDSVKGELDFVIETRQGQVFPLEIKSGKSYKRHNALSNVLSTTNYHIEQAYVFCERNLSTNQRITYCPIYMIGFI
ncbi:MAG: AAA family ATPase [Coriobacteriia bacterium]|nr:AAA family ATPase [Coriobacteriia bacterium]